MKNRFNKLLALLLAVVMVVGILPAGIIAVGAEDAKPILIVAGSDFQDPDTQTNNYTAQNTRIKTIIGKITDFYDGVYGETAFFGGGDYEFDSTNSTTRTTDDVTQIANSVKAALGTGTALYLIEGNHDAMASSLIGTGAHDADGYGVFVISEEDYESKPASGTKTLATAGKLDTYLSEKAAAKYAKPIFILSHVPLHYSTRTKADKDAMYAYYLYEVVEKYAEDLNIIWLFGHDHAWSDDDYLGGSSVYLKPGDTINIAGTKGAEGKLTPSQNAYSSMPLDFVYMNYGYTGYYWSSWNNRNYNDGKADSTLTMTSFLIDGDSVEIRRWDANGEHVLKAAGAKSPGKRGVAEVCDPDTSVVSGPQTMLLKNVNAAPATEPPTEAPTEPPTEAPAEPPVEPSDLTWQKITIPGSTETKYIYTLDTDGIDDGKRYLILAPAGTDKAIVAGGTNNRLDNVSVTGNKAEVDGPDYDWTVTITPETIDYTGKSVTLDPKKDSTETLQNATSYYYLDGNTYYRINSASLYRSKGGYSYTWTIKCENSKTYKPTNKSITLYVLTETPATLTLKNTSNGTKYISPAAKDNDKKSKPPVGTTTADWEWTTEGGGVYQIKALGQWFVRYFDGWALSNSPDSTNFKYRNLRWYEYTPETIVHPDTYYWLAADGIEDRTVPTGAYADQAALEAYLESLITVYRSDVADHTDKRLVDFTITPAPTSVDPAEEGEVTYTVKSGDDVVGTFKVTLKNKEIKDVTLKNSGEVYRQADSTAKTGSKLFITYEDDSTDEIEVTLEMVGEGYDINTAGTYTGLTVTYAGRTINDYTLEVLPKPSENDYPEYPNGGSVHVGKTGQGIDFQNTGIVNIELSAAGIPLQKGVDVIVMLDTSSSMTKNSVKFTDADGKSQEMTRLDIMKASLKSLVAQLSTNSDGSEADVRIAIADFNGYGQINTNDKLTSSVQSAENKGKVYTGAHPGTKLMDSSAFVPASSVTDAIIDGITASSGTNYDFAFDSVYRLGASIQAENELNGEIRDLYVIFMSDGAPFQYNYYMTNSTYTNSITADSTTNWSAWITGRFNKDNTQSPYTNSPHKYFYNPGTVTDPEEGEVAVQRHWMAEAIKGAKTDTFTVISPDNTLPGAVANSDQYMYTVPGLGATMYSIGFCLCDDQGKGHDTGKQGALESEMRHTIKYLASTDENGAFMYFEAQTPDQLNDAFSSIASDITYAATGAYFIDTMGDLYDVTMAPFTYEIDGVSKTVTPSIKVTYYPVYAESDVGKTIGGHTVTAADVGKRYGTGEVVETVTFDINARAVYSDKLSGNIFKSGSVEAGKGLRDSTYDLSGGYIEAKNFVYNNGTEPLEYTDGDRTVTIPAKSFYWKLGTINEQEMVLSYYAYLTGTMEGQRPAGSYPANKDAILYYDNWLSHEAHLDTVPPVMPWQSANISYAFYLVNENGEIVVNKTTGQTGSFANKIAVTDPIVYKTIMLNSGEDIAADVVANQVLPGEYKLYDTGAGCSVTVTSAGGGSWNVTSSADPHTTYVTNYHGVEYTNATSAENGGYDYSHITVWFAVEYTVRTVPDTVVVDYGRPVEVHVLINDMLGNGARLVGIGPISDVSDLIDTNKHNDKLPASFVTKDLELSFGTAAIDPDTQAPQQSKVVYSLSTMGMTDAEKFAYAVRYDNESDESNSGYYYGTITVIPATIIYYEDTENFIAYEGDWEKTDTADKMQGEDRPGAYSLAQIDADNIYGFDPMNKTYTADSLGGSHKVTVAKGDAPSATFTFTGTGFDIISRTDRTTGAILVDVKGENDFDKTWVVDTFYGMKMNLDGYIRYVWEYDGEMWHADGEQVDTKGTDASQAPEDPEEGDTFIAYEPNYNWEPDTAADTLYQIPVIKSETLDYGTYTVTIRPYYHAYFDHTGKENYDFYLDAIRIYEPAKGSETAEAAYLKDHEAFPEFIEIRNELITAAKAGDLELDEEKDKKINGALFIDAFGTYTGASVYAEFGPNNEVYLKPGQAISFIVDGTGVDKVHVSAKAVNTAVTLQVMLGETVSKSIAINTSTDMYYDITDTVNGESKTITLKNTGSGILSLTNLKITHTSAPAALQSAPPTKLYMTAGAAAAVSGQIRDAYVAANTKVTFKPAELKVKAARSTVTRGETVTMTVTTSYDVAAVKVNGLGASLVCSDRATGEKVWTFSAPALIDGTYPASVVALNGAGVESAAVVKNVTVYGNGEMNALKGARNAMNGRFTAVQLDEAV